jgi:hypothetical protein
MPKKSITVARLKDPEKPGRRIKRTGNDWVSTETEIIPSSRIEIFDVFSYWGTRFVDALDTMPRIRLSNEQIKKIVAGKTNAAFITVTGSQKAISPRCSNTPHWS